MPEEIITLRQFHYCLLAALHFDEIQHPRQRMVDFLLEHYSIDDKGVYWVGREQPRQPESGVRQ